MMGKLPKGVIVMDPKKNRTLFLASFVALVIIVAGVSSVITWSFTSQSSVKAPLQSVRPCSGNSLSAFENHQGAGGSMYVSVIFLNSAKTDCSLNGFPIVTLHNANGIPMTHESQRNSPWIHSRQIIVSSGGVAGFVMQFADGAVTGIDPTQGCREATSMQVKLPTVLQYDLPYLAYFSVPLAPCDGGGFEVTAIQSGNPLP
jgi:hypothetical protein